MTLICKVWFLRFLLLADEAQFSALLPPASNHKQPGSWSLVVKMQFIGLENLKSNTICTSDP